MSEFVAGIATTTGGLGVKQGRKENVHDQKGGQVDRAQQTETEVHQSEPEPDFPVAGTAVDNVVFLSQPFRTGNRRSRLGDGRVQFEDHLLAVDDPRPQRGTETGPDTVRGRIVAPVVVGTLEITAGGIVVARPVGRRGFAFKNFVRGLIDAPSAVRIGIAAVTVGIVVLVVIILQKMLRRRVDLVQTAQTPFQAGLAAFFAAAPVTAIVAASTATARRSRSHHCLCRKECVCL